MEMDYTKKELWLHIIEIEDVIFRLNNGETLKTIQVELNEKYKLNLKDKFSGGALSKALTRYGYKKYNGNYIHEDDLNFNMTMTSIDIEDTIETIANKRYEDCYGLNYFYRDGYESVSVDIDKQIYEEYKEMSKEFFCDFDEEYLTMVLLEHLEQYRFIDKREEFALNRLNKMDISKEEKDALIGKQKQGYRLNKLLTWAEDNNILDISNEEFERIAEEYNFKSCEEV